MAKRTATTAIPYIEATVAERRFDTTRANIDMVILHTNVGSAQSTIDLFGSPPAPGKETSAHYLVKLDGILIHFLEEYNTAYQAGDYPINQRSIGIEHEDNGNYNDGVRTDAEYTTSAKLVADICKFYTIPIDREHIKKHNEVSDAPTACPDGLDVERIVREAAGQAGTATEDPLVCDPKSVRDGLVAKASAYDNFVNAGYKTVEDITLKLKTEQESIDSLNKKIQTDEGTVTTQTEQLQQLEQQLKAKQDTIDILQLQADSANKFQALFNQCDTDRNTWVTKETSYTRSIAQYQGQIKRIKETSWESASTGTVLLAALHRILPFIPSPTIDNGVASGGDS